MQPQSLQGGLIPPAYNIWVDFLCGRPLYARKEIQKRFYLAKCVGNRALLWWILDSGRPSLEGLLNLMPFALVGLP